MSGDVQPRKRKDKKRKKDELGVEEPRGTAAALGEGDVFIHSQHDHGTGGHWCAKIIFFSLLVVLITLVGLIILENRGLSELEANSVESRYSGVLEGWLEDAPDDDHHDEHTLELNHPDDEEDDNGHDDDNEELEQDQEDEHEHEDEDENEDGHDEEDELDQSDNEDDDDEESNEQQDVADSQEENDEDDQEDHHRTYYDDEETENDDDEQQVDESEEANENNKDDGSHEDNIDDSTEDGVEQENELKDDSEEGAYNEEENTPNDEDEDEHDEEDEEDTEVEVERIEKEIDLEPISTELPALPEDDDDDDNDKSEEQSTDEEAQEKEDDDDGVAPEDLDDDFLEDDTDEPPIERITAPVGKPLVEVEEEDSLETPPDTLAEEEEYEKQQDEKKREEEKSSHKDGGNSIEDEWPGEPSDSFWRQELDSAEDDLRRGSWSSAAARASSAELRGSARARWLQARAADMQAEAERDNRQLGHAIAAYLELLKMHERLPDDKLRQVAARALDRIMFRGNYLSAEPVYKLLIRRFPDEVAYRNNLTISFLMANRADLAEEILKETLQKWPNDRVALAHYGFVLKTLRNRLEEAVEAFQKALEGDSGPANEPRFYYHLGDALLLLGRPAEAHEVHKRGAKLGHFLSPSQRSLYNVPQLKSQAWWNVEETPYAKLARALEKNWKEILKEGEAAKALYEKEKEGLKERGDWSQLDLFARGQEIPNRCKNAPVTCSIVRSEPAAVGCRRGQIKFSAMVPGTHVRPHVGPTNCRLRMHLALSNTKNTFIRVDQTVRQWQTGKVLMFDDSFEHEVWHNGTGTRLVLIVDVWHPDLTPRQRRSLPAI